MCTAYWKITKLIFFVNIDYFYCEIVPWVNKVIIIIIIDKLTLPTVRFDPSDSCYLSSDNILRMAKCLAMQEVRNTIYTTLLSRWFPS